MTDKERSGQEAQGLPGDNTATPMETALDQVRDRWVAGGEFAEQTLDRCGETITRFARRLAAQNVTDPAQITLAHCRGFVAATTAKGRPPELTTQHARRTSLRMMFRSLRELGYDVTDPTLDLQLPARTGTTARPLTDAEITLGRTSARLGEAGGVSLQRAVCWALAEATAVSSEISAIRVGDVDDPHSPRWVQLPGTRRHDPRLGELSEWGRTIVARQLAALEERRSTPVTLLTYRGKATPGEAKAQAAVCNAVAAILDLAGLAAEADVRPASVRNWAGRHLLEAGMPIDQVARRLGARTLDSAAADVALQWR